MSENADTPGAVGIVQQAQRPAMEICRAVYNGTLFLRESPEYLPQWEKEDKGPYAVRLAGSVLFNAYKKTVKSLTGIVFREPVAIGDDVPKEMIPHFDNIDLSGQHLDQFVQHQFREKLIDGHDHILVDWHGPEGARSKADERKGLARPYWTLVRKGQVARHWTMQEGGAVVLASFAYQETEVIKKGTFGQAEVKRIRQFDLVNQSGEPFPENEDLPGEAERRVLFQTWVQTEDGGEWEQEVSPEKLGDLMTRIPIATDYSDRTGFMTSEPPLLDLALENLKHWQTRSDRDINLHVTSIPIFNVYGLKAEELQTVTVGNAMGLAFPKGRQEQGSEYVEAMGHGLAHSREELLDIQQRMASLGTSMLERQKRVAETEKAKMMDKTAEDSELTAQARATTDSLREALVLHAMWMGLDPKAAGSLTVNTEFEAQQMSPEMFDKYLKAVGEGNLSVETMWDRLVAGQLLPDPFDAELEKERLANQGTKELEAMAEAARRMREAGGEPEGEDDDEGTDNPGQEEDE